VQPGLHKVDEVEEEEHAASPAALLGR
jgi:hypothetical protein